MSELRVLFTPWLSENPYQRRLAEELAAEGVSVRGCGAITRRATRLRDTVRDVDPQVLHLHWLEYQWLTRRLDKSMRRAIVLLARLRALRRRGVRLVWTAHNLASHESRQPRLEAFVTRRVIALSDGVIAHCESARRAIHDFVPGLDADLVTVVPHGNYVDSYPPAPDRQEARAALAIDPERFVLLFLGRVRPYKGLAEVVRCVAAEPPTPETLLVVAGAGTLDPVSMAHADRSEHVRLDLGFVPPDRVPLHLAAADAVVLPYREVFTSGSAVLAMSFGRPVVAPRLGCLAELLAGQDDLLYDPDRPDGLAGALRAAWRSREALATVGAANLARASAWPWRRCAGETAAFYRRVVAARARR